MNVSPFEPEVPAGSADRAAGRPGDGDAPADMRASQDGKDEDQRREEPVDEPGYGHGV